MTKTPLRILALFLSLSLAAPHPVLALREQPVREKKPAVLAGLEDALRGDPAPLIRLTSAALIPAPVSSAPTPALSGQVVPLAAAGAEESYVDKVKKLVVSTLLPAIDQDIKRRSSLGPWFYRLLTRRDWESAFLRFDAPGSKPRLALIDGEKGERWVHMHHIRTGMGLILRLVLSQDGTFPTVDRLMAEPLLSHSSQKHPFNPDGLEGFVPLEGLLSPGALETLREAASRKINSQAGLLQAARERRPAPMVLARAVEPPGARGLFQIFLRKNVKSPYEIPGFLQDPRIIFRQLALAAAFAGAEEERNILVSEAVNQVRPLIEAGKIAFVRWGDVVLEGDAITENAVLAQAKKVQDGGWLQVHVEGETAEFFPPHDYRPFRGQVAQAKRSLQAMLRGVVRLPARWIIGHQALSSYPELYGFQGFQSVHLEGRRLFEKYPKRVCYYTTGPLDPRAKKFISNVARRMSGTPEVVVLSGDGLKEFLSQFLSIGGDQVLEAETALKTLAEDQKRKRGIAAGTEEAASVFTPEELSRCSGRWMREFVITGSEIRRLVATYNVFASYVQAGRVIGDLGGTNRALNRLLTQGIQRSWNPEAYQVWINQLPESALVGRLADRLEDRIGGARETDRPQTITVVDFLKELGLNPADVSEQARITQLLTQHGIEVRDGTVILQLNLTLLRPAAVPQVLVPIPPSPSAAGTEERIEEPGKEDFFRTLLPAGVDGQSPLVITAGLEAAFPALGNLAGLESYGIHLQGAEDPGSFVARLIAQNPNLTGLRAAGLEAEMPVFGAVAQMAGLEFSGISPENRTSFRGVLLAILSALSGAEESAIEAIAGFEAFMAGLKASAQAA